MTPSRDEAAQAASLDVANWTPMVVLASRRRVVHFAVWGSAARGRPGALCRNRGDLPVYGRLDEFPGVPVCTRCKSEVELLTSAIRSVES